jgi:hypothetical protein
VSFQQRARHRSSLYSPSEKKFVSIMWMSLISLYFYSEHPVSWGDTYNNLNFSAVTIWTSIYSFSSSSGCEQMA